MKHPIFSDIMIERALVALRSRSRFSTADVIENSTGQPYRRNAGVPAGSSPNARTGKRLSKNAAAWSIRPVGEVKITDADGVTTQAMTWEWVA
jgi:hypothetical protein